MDEKEKQDEYCYIDQTGGDVSDDNVSYYIRVNKWGIPYLWKRSWYFQGDAPEHRKIKKLTGEETEFLTKSKNLKCISLFEESNKPKKDELTKEDLKKKIKKITRRIDELSNFYDMIHTNSYYDNYDESVSFEESEVSDLSRKIEILKKLSEELEGNL